MYLREKGDFFLELLKRSVCLSVHLFPLFLSYFHVIRVLRFGLLLRALHEEQTVVVIVAVVEQVQHKREEKRSSRHTDRQTGRPYLKQQTKFLLSL